MDKKLRVDTVSQWNNSVRRLLAITTGQPVPADDDELCTTQTEYNDDFIHNEYDNDQMEIEVEEGKKTGGMGGFTSALTQYKKRSSSSNTRHTKKRNKSAK